MMLKKMLTVLMCLCMLLSMVCVQAEEAPMEYGVITPVASETSLDLDGDGTAEQIKFEIVVAEDGYDTGYTLKVNDQTVEGDGWDVNRQLYALCLDDYDGSLFLMVSDYGPSDDHQTTFYYWQNNEIQSAGTIYALPENMKVSDNGVITASVRGKLLHTWFHEADFAMAVGYDADWNESHQVYQIPRYVYPMGTMVTVKVDLPLVSTMSGEETTLTIPAGTQAILCATDDVEWVCIQMMDGAEPVSGWMRVAGEYGYECVVGDELLYSYDVFDGLMFAD